MPAVVDFKAYTAAGKRLPSWRVMAAVGGSPLGEIVYRESWRQYVFEPRRGVLLAANTLVEISSFMTKLRVERERKSVQRVREPVAKTPGWEFE